MSIIAPVAPPVNTTATPARWKAIDWRPGVDMPDIGAPAQAAPATTLDVDVSPFMLGALDAERGEIACAEMYFVRDGQIAEYCEGYESVKGPTLTTQQILGSAYAVVVPKHILTDAEMEAEAADYEEAMVDEMFHRSGAW